MREGRQTTASHDEQGTPQGIEIDIVRSRIRGLREARALSLEEVAKAAGLSLDVLKDIERGKKDPSIDELSSIAAGLEVPLPQLFGDLTPTAVVAAALFEGAPKSIQNAVRTILRHPKGDA